VAYRGLLISAIHGCAVRFPEVASNVVQLLMDFLNGEGALSVIEFVREIVETFPDMRGTVLTKLRAVAGDIASSDVHRVALWILGQYSQSGDEVAAALHTIRECIGPLPLTIPFSQYALASVAAGKSGAGGGAESDDTNTTSAAAAKVKGPVVLADGTYASQSALEATGSGGKRGGGGTDLDDVPVPSLRRLLLAGDFYLGSVVASTLTKLALRTTELAGRESRSAKATLVDAMLVLCSLIELGGSSLAGTSTLLPAHLMPLVSGRSYGSSRPGGGGGGGAGASGAAGGAGSSGALSPNAAAEGGSGASGLVAGSFAPNALTIGGGLASSAGGSSAAIAPVGIRIDQDSFERIALCMRVLGDPDSAAIALPVLLHTCRATFRNLLLDRRGRAAQALADGVSAAAGKGVGMSVGSGTGVSFSSGSLQLDNGKAQVGGGCVGGEGSWWW